MNPIRYVMALGAIACTLAAYSAAAPAQTRLWGTYYGGSGWEFPGKIVVDGKGNVFAIGSTSSSMGIATPDAFDPFVEGEDAFLAKFDTDGNLVWATYYGDGATKGADLGLDRLGNIYVLGTVVCPSVELASPGAFDTTCSNLEDMYLAKFDPQGKRVWGTYFGGQDHDFGHALHVSDTGDVYLAGDTYSQGIVPLPSVDSSLGGGSDALIAKFNTQGKLLWARYLGGPGGEWGYDIACRRASGPEQCYVTGGSTSLIGFATFGAHDTTLAGTQDAFLSRIDSATGAIVWNTYYGGSDTDVGYRVLVDKDLNAIVGGITLSPDAIATLNAPDPTPNGSYDVFLAKFSVGGVRSVGTYFGNAKSDSVHDMALDASGNLYLLGTALSPQNLATPGAYDTVMNGLYDAVLTKFDPQLFRLWGTFYGGGQFETLNGGSVAVGGDGHIHILSDSTSQDAIATPGAHQTINMLQDVFLVEFSQ